MAKKRDTIFFIILLFVSLIVLSINSPRRKNITKVKKVFSYLYRETSTFFSNMVFVVGDYFRASKLHKETFYENIRLKKEIIKLKEENVLLKDFILKKGFNVPLKEDFLLIARVISWDLEEPYRTFYINKGNKDKIEINSPVVDEYGFLVGKIIEPLFPHGSTVLLISNPEFGVGVKIGEKEALGILFGMGKDKGIIKYIRLTTKIKIGDPVYTSGLDMTFPEGLKIGNIVEVKKGYYAIEAISDLKALKHNPRYVGILKYEKNR